MTRSWRSHRSVPWKRGTTKSDFHRLAWSVVAGPGRRCDLDRARGHGRLDGPAGQARTCRRPAAAGTAIAAAGRRRTAAVAGGGDAAAVGAVRARASLAPASAGGRTSRLAAKAMGGRLAISGLSELHETGTDSSGTLHQAAEEAVARERARMARELHDGLATELAGAISLFKVYLEGHKNDREQPLLDVFGILERMLKQVRDTLAELRPKPIGPEGLVGELHSQGEEFARLYSIRVEISSSGTEDMLPPPQREVVYQVVREALANVRKHSGSSICRVRMHFSAHPFMVEVADEGRGLGQTRDGGYGLVGMRERAAGIGGRLEVVSTQGKGTTVFLFGPQ